MIKSSACLDEETLTSYLEGLLERPVRAAAESHLVECDSCRSQLVYYMRILDEDVHEDEESVLAAVIAAAGERRPAVAASGRKRTLRIGWIAAAAALLVAVGLGGILGRTEVSDPQQLLSQMLLNDRPFEARLSEQPYVPYSQVRGADVQREDLGYEEEMRAADSHLLAAFLLYRRDFDEAIRLLDRLRLDMPSASVYNDLGVAYLETTDTSADERERNRGLARENFNQALELDPDFDASAYNLVILSYRDDLPFAQVQEQFERFIQMNPEPEWVNELSGLTGLSIPASR